MKPRAIVISSSEGLDVAYAIQEQLEADAEVTVWNQAVFEPARTTLDALLRAVDTADMGLFVFGPDDAVQVRGETHLVPRDNVLLEFGLFVGRLGLNRCFMLVPSGPAKLKLPTDLAGLVVAQYQPDREDHNLVAAVGPACNKVRRVLRSTVATNA